MKRKVFLLGLKGSGRRDFARKFLGYKEESENEDFKFYFVSCFSFESVNILRKAYPGCLTLFFSHGLEPGDRRNAWNADIVVDRKEDKEAWEKII